MEAAHPACLSVIAHREFHEWAKQAAYQFLSLHGPKLSVEENGSISV